VIRTLRRIAVVALMAATASAGLVVSRSTPAPAADTVGYTVEVQIPRGILSFCRLATVDLGTGEVTGIGAVLDEPLACASDLAFAPNGTLYGITDVPGDDDKDEPIEGTDDVTPLADDAVHLVRFDTATGAVTDLGPIGTAPARLFRGGGGVTFDAAGRLWVYMAVDDADCQDEGFCLYQVDPANPAAATFFGGNPQQTTLYGLTASCSLGVFTVAESFRPGDVAADDDEVLVIPGGDLLDAVNPGPPAVATPVGSVFDDDQTVQSLDFGADGTTLWAIGTIMPNGLGPPGQLSTLDPATGVLSAGPLLTTDGDISLAVGLAVAPPSCPPTTPPVELQPTFTG
jgi:hypothetical protein